MKTLGLVREQQNVKQDEDAPEKYHSRACNVFIFSGHLLTLLRVPSDSNEQVFIVHL